MAKNLLLVDDSVAIREVVALTFENSDLNIRTSADLEEAWNAIQENPPDIVLADADKPQIGGWDLCRRIKETPDFGSMPVILFSGEEDDSLNPMDITPDALLKKPFGAEDLGKTVGAFLDVAPAGDSPEPETLPEDTLEPPDSGEAGAPEEAPLDFSSLEPEKPRGAEGDEEPLVLTEDPVQTASAAERGGPSEDVPPPSDGGPDPGSESGREVVGESGPDPSALNRQLESAIHKAVADALGPLDQSEVHRIVASALREALRDIAPQIAGLVEQVAREVVPELAEIWIEREIRRLTSGD